jgi:hypothetical protein
MSQTSVNFGSECRKFCISILLNLRLARPPGSTEWPPCPRRSLGAGRRAPGGGRLPETNRAPAIRDCGSRLAAVAHIGRVPQSCGWKRRGRRRIHRECAPQTGPRLFFGGLYLADPHGASAAEQGESNSPSRPDLHGIMGMRTPMTDKHPKHPNQLAL